jgi:hypothetical protein
MEEVLISRLDMSASFNLVTFSSINARVILRKRIKRTRACVALIAWKNNSVCFLHQQQHMELSWQLGN